MISLALRPGPPGEDERRMGLRARRVLVVALLLLALVLPLAHGLSGRSP